MNCGPDKTHSPLRNVPPESLATSLIGDVEPFAGSPIALLSSLSALQFTPPCHDGIYAGQCSPGHSRQQQANAATTAQEPPQLPQPQQPQQLPELLQCLDDKLARNEELAKAATTAQKPPQPPQPQQPQQLQELLQCMDDKLARNEELIGRKFSPRKSQASNGSQGWEMRTSRSTGQVYYVNKQLGLSQFEPPPGFNGYLSAGREKHDDLRADTSTAESNSSPPIPPKIKLPTLVLNSNSSASPPKSARSSLVSILDNLIQQEDSCEEKPEKQRLVTSGLSGGIASEEENCKGSNQQEQQDSIKDFTIDENPPMQDSPHMAEAVESVDVEVLIAKDSPHMEVQSTEGAEMQEVFFGEEVQILGFEIVWKIPTPMVGLVEPHGAAQEVGIHPGDYLVMVNECPTGGRCREELLPFFRERPLTLKVFRADAGSTTGHKLDEASLELCFPFGKLKLSLQNSTAEEFEAFQDHAKEDEKLLVQKQPEEQLPDKMRLSECQVWEAAEENAKTDKEGPRVEKPELVSCVSLGVCRLELYGPDSAVSSSSPAPSLPWTSSARVVNALLSQRSSVLAQTSTAVSSSDLDQTSKSSSSSCTSTAVSSSAPAPDPPGNNSRSAPEEMPKLKIPTLVLSSNGSASPQQEDSCEEKPEKQRLVTLGLSGGIASEEENCKGSKQQEQQDSIFTNDEGRPNPVVETSLELDLLFGLLGRLKLSLQDSMAEEFEASQDNAKEDEELLVQKGLVWEAAEEEEKTDEEGPRVEKPELVSCISLGVCRLELYGSTDSAVSNSSPAPDPPSTTSTAVSSSAPAPDPPSKLQICPRGDAPTKAPTPANDLIEGVPGPIKGA